MGIKQEVVTLSVIYDDSDTPDADGAKPGWMAPAAEWNWSELVGEDVQVIGAGDSAPDLLARRMVDECFDALRDNAGNFTCAEADVMAAWLDSVRPGYGDAFIECHAHSDDEGDSHYRWMEGN